MSAVLAALALAAAPAPPIRRATLVDLDCPDRCRTATLLVEGRVAAVADEAGPAGTGCLLNPVLEPRLSAEENRVLIGVQVTHKAMVAVAAGSGPPLLVPRRNSVFVEVGSGTVEAGRLLVGALCPPWSASLSPAQRQVLATQEWPAPGAGNAPVDSATAEAILTRTFDGRWPGSRAPSYRMARSRGRAARATRPPVSPDHMVKPPEPVTGVIANLFPSTNVAHYLMGWSSDDVRRIVIRSTPAGGVLLLDGQPLTLRTDTVLSVKLAMVRRLAVQLAAQVIPLSRCVTAGREGDQTVFTCTPRP